MRSKEEANDYRYFPDPDLLPVVLDDAFLTGVRATLPELPDEKKARFTLAAKPRRSEIQYTSDTSGAPKMPTHDGETREVYANALRVAVRMRWISPTRRLPNESTGAYSPSTARSRPCRRPA